MHQTPMGQTTALLGQVFDAARDQRVRGPFLTEQAEPTVIARGQVTTHLVLELKQLLSTPQGPLTYVAQTTPGLGVTVRHGRQLADYILRLVREDERELFLRDVLYAACEGLERLDWWPLAETMNGWEATAEVEENPQLSKELDEAIAAYREGR